ncbi:MAG TPA: YgiQ family radical SAM protein [Spirochaetota bacterium]|nr:YgiQ family radical SAM protein [Spirochaetota bacterium]
MKTACTLKDWLPVTKKDAEARGWDRIDVILFSGDAYVDHPAFGSAVIARLIESRGLRVAIVPQPNWRDDLRDFTKFGRPELFFAVTSGCMDSMVNHYTANRRLRSDDAYSPDGKSGFRPDYALTVYCRILKEIYPDVPVVAGGIEASLRRLTHYDYWSDSLRPSVLCGASPDMVIYGMAEKALNRLLDDVIKGEDMNTIMGLEQTCFRIASIDDIPHNINWSTVELYSHEECLASKHKFADNYMVTEKAGNSMEPVRFVQRCGAGYIVVNPPCVNITTGELDHYSNLPFTRLPHPKYAKKGGVPAYEMIRHSVTAHRGCFGGCSFCAITAHQGKNVVSRSQASIISEVEKVAAMPDFKGYVSDIGGPSANMYMMEGADLKLCVKCARPSCIYPSICSNLNYDHTPLIELYDKAAAVKGVKKIFVSSGVRYDMLVSGDESKRRAFRCEEYIKVLVTRHVSGRLKVAPEHTSDRVLSVMRKPSYSVFRKFMAQFRTLSQQAGLKQHLVPYFISSHPGSQLEDMAELAAETKDDGFRLEQVQDFTPTPMTLSSVIYYCGFDPYNGKKIYCARSADDRNDQRSFLFWYRQENKEKLRRRLKKIGRHDIEKRLFG